MQPFGIPKNPKMTVQTRKQPPVQRYPNPYSTPSQPKTNPAGSAQKKIGANPFAEENNSTTAFDIAQSFGAAGGFEESEGPLQTPERFNSDGFNQHHRGVMNFEETPAALARGQDLAGDEGGYLEDQSVPDNERNEPPQSVPMQNLSDSPAKNNLRGRDDDEYVRVESENELEEEPQIRNKNEIPRGTPAKLAKPAGFGSANKENVGRNNNPAGYEEEQRRTSAALRTQQHPQDVDALLQIKRLELELAKERQRADFFEGEQNKLISENTELRRRTEELNAKVDLAKRYDTSERLAKKEEEVERLKIEVNSVSEERRMLEEHYQRLLNENAGFRNESDSLIFSIQEENRRLQEEVQNIRREMDVRVGSKITIVNEKNVLLENEVTELRQQIQNLTDQLTLKANYDQRIAGFNQELDSLAANLSKTTSHTQTQVPPVHTQLSQTSPTKIHAMETQTQAQGANVELNEAQTSPIKFPEQGRPQLSVQTFSPTRFDSQDMPKSATKSAIKISPSPSKPKQTGLNTPEIKKNPFGQPASGSQLRPPVFVEEVQAVQTEEAPQNADFLDSFKVEGEETVETPAYIPENVRNSPLYPPRAQASAPEDEESEDEIKQEDRPLQIHQEDERPPITINRSPLLRSPQADSQEKSSPAIPSHGLAQANSGATGTRGLMGVPQYKVPQRSVPKKPAGFKPMSANPFANEAENVQEEIVAPVTEELPPAQELVHHINPTTDQQEPIHSTFEEKPPVMTSKPPQNNDEVPPARNLMGGGAQPRTNAPNNIPINRPPLFNAKHQGKTQKIGKNPFSTEEPSPALKTEETNFEEQKQTPQVFEQQLPTENNEISNEAAENFFDQLGSGNPPPVQQQQVQMQKPPVTTHIPTTQPFRTGQPRFPVPSANQTKLTSSVSSLKRGGGANPFAEEEAPKAENTTLQSSFTQQDTTADLTQSFQSEEKPEPGKMVPGKSVALKKKKAALPGNMFD